MRTLERAVRARRAHPSPVLSTDVASASWYRYGKCRPCSRVRNRARVPWYPVMAWYPVTAGCSAVLQARKHDRTVFSHVACCVPGERRMLCDRDCRCHSCRQCFCLGHRLEPDHNCAGKRKTVVQSFTRLAMKYPVRPRTHARTHDARTHAPLRPPSLDRDHDPPLLPTSQPAPAPVETAYVRWLGGRRPSLCMAGRRQRSSNSMHQQRSVRQHTHAHARPRPRTHTHARMRTATHMRSCTSARARTHETITPLTGRRTRPKGANRR